MTKFLVRSFLSLCMLLLSGSGQLYVHGYTGSFHNSSSDLSERLEQLTFDTGENSLLLFKKFAASERDKTFIIESTEGKEEDEYEREFISREKNRQDTNNFVAIFCALTRGYFFSYTKEILSFRKHFSDLSSYRRHLIFQVFII